MAMITQKNQVFWYLKPDMVNQLRTDIKTDVVIVGGGMAGLTAAQQFAKQGLRVALIEKYFCGSGASGKSSGFITQDAELSLADIMQQYGPVEAKKIWEFITSGVNIIRANIEQFSIDCDYRSQDTLVLANSKRAFNRDICIEYQARTQLGYQSTLYDQQQVQKIIGSDQFYGGISYPNTFGISGYRYCQAMKKVLQDSGVQIYEESPMIELSDHLVKTTYGSVVADHIIVSIDHQLGNCKDFADKVYHVQTFLMVSAPLTDQEIKKLFPANRSFMIWDTDLVYQYYRLTGDNRLLLGGADIWESYASREQFCNESIARHLTGYFAKKFPTVSLQFDYIWPGLIGISKDFFPIAGRDRHMPSVYYISAAAGLPWAAALGNYSAAALLHNDTSFDRYFSPYRPTKIGPGMQRLLGRKLSFALANFLTVGSI